MDFNFQYGDEIPHKVTTMRGCSYDRYHTF